MAKQQHATQQQEPQLFWELKRTQEYKYQTCATSGCLPSLVPVITDVSFFFFFIFLLAGLISHQSIEVNVKAVLVYMTVGTLVPCLARSEHPVDSGLICEPRLSDL